ncbi:MAG: hypothetical protein CL624_13990 [Arcobacter sp.]|nr:hypothetical protein [Arcobacter sp.]
MRLLKLSSKLWIRKNRLGILLSLGGALFLAGFFFIMNTINSWSKESFSLLDSFLFTFSGFFLPIFILLLIPTLLSYAYIEDKAVLRCGELFFPFYDEIVVDKSIIDNAFTEIRKNSKDSD